MLYCYIKKNIFWRKETRN